MKIQQANILLNWSSVLLLTVVVGGVDISETTINRSQQYDRCVCTSVCTKCSLVIWENSAYWTELKPYMYRQVTVTRCITVTYLTFQSYSSFNCSQNVRWKSTHLLLPGVVQVWPQPLEQHFKSPVQSASFEHSSQHTPTLAGGHWPNLAVKYNQSTFKSTLDALR